MLAATTIIVLLVCIGCSSGLSGEAGVSQGQALTQSCRLDEAAPQESSHSAWQPHPRCGTAHACCRLEMDYWSSCCAFVEAVSNLCVADPHPAGLSFGASASAPGAPMARCMITALPTSHAHSLPSSGCRLPPAANPPALRNRQAAWQQLALQSSAQVILTRVLGSQACT